MILSDQINQHAETLRKRRLVEFWLNEALRAPLRQVVHSAILLSDVVLGDMRIGSWFGKSKLEGVGTCKLLAFFAPKLLVPTPFSPVILV